MLDTVEAGKPGNPRPEVPGEVEAFGILAPLIAGKGEREIDALADRLETFRQERRAV